MKTTAKGIGHMVHNYDMYPVTNLPRSKFPRNHTRTTAFNAGYLIPIYWREFYPGDTLILECGTLTRLLTQIVPFMDEVYMDVHFWDVPKRLTWTHWPNMHGERPNPTDSIDYLVPQLTTPSGGVAVGSIFDYFDVRPGVSNIKFNVWPYRAYNMVWNEDYRDENLQQRVPQVNGDTDDISNYTLLKRGKRKDYFTSCLPAPQKGAPVEIPLGTVAPVYGNGLALGLTNGTTNAGLGSIAGGTGPSAVVYDSIYGQNVNSTTTSGSKVLGNIGITTDGSKSGLVADLSNATAATINSLLQAFAVQHVLVKDNIGGDRYIEQILAHYSVKSPDARLQRPEFIGGGTFNLNMSIVPQTSATDTISPQGNLSSYGVINGFTKKIVHSFTEHSDVIGVVSIRSNYTYQQGMPRDYFRQSRFDYWYPELSNIAEQPVYNREIFTQGQSVTDSITGAIVDNEVFGYQEAWADLRTGFNRITGVMRSDAANSLDYWHLAQDFSALPALNSDFIEENPPIDRVIAVNAGDSTPQFLANFFFRESVVSSLPLYSLPQINTHF